MTVLLLVLLALLLALNAFFVLAEFAVVKVRPSRVTQLVAEGDPRAELLEHIQGQLDEYLSVCQVGPRRDRLGLAGRAIEFSGYLGSDP